MRCGKCCKVTTWSRERQRLAILWAPNHLPPVGFWQPTRLNIAAGMSTQKVSILKGIGIGFSDLYSFPMIVKTLSFAAKQPDLWLNLQALHEDKAIKAGILSLGRGWGGPHSKLARVTGPPTASQQRRQRQSCWEAKVHA